MKMETWSANSQREITDFVNEHGITKDMIINIFETSDKTFILNYFTEE